MKSISFVETADGARHRVSRSCVSPEFEGVTYAGGLQHIGDITPDVALVTTYDRIADVTGTVAVSRNLDDGDRVFLAGYHSDAPGVLRGQSCVAHRYGSVWVYDRIEHRCDSVSGSSGSPLLQKRGDGSFAVVGVHSGTADDKSISYAALMGGEEAVDDFILDGHGRFVCSGSVISGHTVMTAALCTGSRAWLTATDQSGCMTALSTAVTASRARPAHRFCRNGATGASP